MEIAVLLWGCRDDSGRENGILAEVSTSLPEHSFIDAVGGRIPNLHGVDPVVLFERFDCSADRWPTHPSNLAKGLAELQSAPEFPAIYEKLKQILTDKPVVIFNANFDVRLIEQTAKAFELDTEWLKNIKTICAMYLSADAFGATNRYGTISLSNAVHNAGKSFSGAAHGAKVDVLATIDVIESIYDSYYSVMAELEQLKSKNKEQEWIATRWLVYTTTCQSLCSFFRRAAARRRLCAVGNFFRFLVVKKTTPFGRPYRILLKYS